MPRFTPHTRETKQKISIANMGHSVSAETRKKISIAITGKKASAKTRKKMSLARKGKKMPPFTKKHKENLSKVMAGRIPWNKGKKGVQTSYWKGKRNPHMVGEKNPSWRGGVTALGLKIRRLPEFKKWRKSVFERDSYACQKCGDNKGGNLEAHHLVPLAWLIYYHGCKKIEDVVGCDELWDINNGQTLCKDCHNLTKNVRRTQCLKN